MCGGVVWQCVCVWGGGGVVDTSPKPRYNKRQTEEEVTRGDRGSAGRGVSYVSSQGRGKTAASKRGDDRPRHDEGDVVNIFSPNCKCPESQIPEVPSS